MSNTKIEMKVHTFRKLPSPYMDGEMNSDVQMMMILVKANQIPIGISTDTNPRDQNMRTKVAKRIQDGLITDNNAFYILNRGILISAKDVIFNNINSTVTIDLGDNSNIYGIVDGGHTYRTIINNKDKIIKSNQYVRLEVITGIEDIFEDVAAARNTSVPVSDTAIAELKEYFDKIVKNSIKDEPYANKIAYKENSEEPIDLADMLTLMFMYNLDKFPNKEIMPVQAYSSKAMAVKDYLKNYEEFKDTINNPYYKMKPIITDIIKIADTIEVEMGAKYREKLPKGSYGSVTGVESISGTSKFLNKPINHKTSKGLMYPIIGAFRSLIEEDKDTGFYRWKVDPLEIWRKTGATLVQDTVERSRSFKNNPQSAGKDVGLWRQNYQTVLTQYLMDSMGL
ncbi:AIPR family protein [Bacillus cereus group sp. MYBK163-2]|uniref:AIPR family protein n=1 Tax=Bacillus cereus group TaxID=86661 RepID=UPI000A301B64|nr:AIPR family protein [Bacillus cereus]SME68407.1 AIPR protein [Bacillus cereus]